MGGGRKATLREMKDKLLYILLYCKCDPTLDLMSVLFNFDRSCAHEWVHRLLPILEVALGYKKALPVRQLTSMKEFVEKFPFVKKVILDENFQCNARKIMRNRKSIREEKTTYQQTHYRQYR